MDNGAVAAPSRAQARRLAGRALAAYPLAGWRSRLLALKDEHALFRVEAREAGAETTASFALRLYAATGRDRASIATEVEWLAALRRDTGLGVPGPVPTRDGALLLELPPADAGPSRRAALFRWVAGRHRRAVQTPAMLAAIGRFVARLHDHATRFAPTVGQAGQWWDWARVFGPDSIVAPDGAAPLLGDREVRALFRAAAARLRATMEGLGTAPDVWGVIHADLHTGNRLFGGGEVRAIDFECCGWGHYLYDLAVILDEIEASHAAHAVTLRAALLAGYREVRPFPAEHEAALDSFVAMRLVELARWYGTSADPAHGPTAVRLVDEAARWMRRLGLPTG
jgi:Ser/Thr protein kinase RdoA (MazF antagonist)